MSPLYDFKCYGCDVVFEMNVPYEHRDIARRHGKCGGDVSRVFINAPKVRELTRYGGMQAVVTRGEDGPVVGRVKGHFNKSAKLRKR